MKKLDAEIKAIAEVEVAEIWGRVKVEQARISAQASVDVARVWERARARQEAKRATSTVDLEARAQAGTRRMAHLREAMGEEAWDELLKLHPGLGEPFMRDLEAKYVEFGVGEYPG